MKELSNIDILTILYFYARNYHAYVYRLCPDFFSDDCSEFFEILQKYYKAYGKVPPKPLFLTECDESSKTAISNLYDVIFSNVESVKHYAHDYIIEKLDHFAKKNYLKKFLINGYDLFEQGKYDTIINNVANLRESLIDNDFGKEYHNDEFFKKRYLSEQSGSVIPSSFVQFDRAFEGWHNKSLNVIAGPANSGKTMWLVNIVTKRLLDSKRTGNKILYITLEIDEDQVGRRIDSCLTGRPMKELWAKRDLGVRELIALSKETHGNRVIIKAMPGYKTTPADIEACIRNLQVVSDGDCTPNMVVVDYLGLLSPNVVTKNMSLYEKGLNIAVELRSLAQTYNIPFIVAAQTNRSSFGDRPGMDSISDSIGISQTADLLMTINRNESLDQNNQVEVYLAKSRFCRNNIKFHFGVNYETMTIGDIENYIDAENEEL